MRVLVTGGAGFIGSNLARHFAEAGDDVTVCDVFGRSDKWRNLNSSSLAGLVLPENLPALLARRRFDLVLHMGAISATTERDIDLIVRTNIELSLALLDYCTDHGTRFIYASSAATYGDGEIGFVDDWSSRALAALRPLNAYGWSKAAFDRMVVRRQEASLPLPPQWAGLKFFNVFGPNEYHKGDMRSVVHKIHGQIRRGEAVTLFKSHRDGIPDGGQQRDFIYVRDCVAVVSWLAAEGAPSGIFNVGTGNARSFHDLGHAVFSTLGRQTDIDFVPMPDDLRDRYQYFTEADTTRLRAAGYQTPFTSLEDSIADYVNGYLEQTDPYA